MKSPWRNVVRSERRENARRIARRFRRLGDPEYGGQWSLQLTCGHWTYRSANRQLAPRRVRCILCPDDAPDDPKPE